LLINGRLPEQFELWRGKVKPTILLKEQSGFVKKAANSSTFHLQDVISPHI